MEVQIDDIGKKPFVKMKMSADSSEHVNISSSGTTHGGWPLSISQTDATKRKEKDLHLSNQLTFKRNIPLPQLRKVFIEKGGTFGEFAPDR